MLHIKQLLNDDSLISRQASEGTLESLILDTFAESFATKAIDLSADNET
jgi:hypothetical protein